MRVVAFSYVPIVKASLDNSVFRKVYFVSESEISSSLHEYIRDKCY